MRAREYYEKNAAMLAHILAKWYPELSQQQAEKNLIDKVMQRPKCKTWKSMGPTSCGLWVLGLINFHCWHSVYTFVMIGVWWHPSASAPDVSADIVPVN